MVINSVTHIWSKRKGDFPKPRLDGMLRLRTALWPWQPPIRTNNSSLSLSLKEEKNSSTNKSVLAKCELLIVKLSANSHDTDVATVL